MPNHRNVYISLTASMSKTGKFQLRPLVFTVPSAKVKRWNWKGRSALFTVLVIPEVGAGGPHHGSYQLMDSSSLHCHRLVEWRRRNELEASMLGTASSHVVGSLRRTLQTLLLPTSISFDRWHMAWLISISALMNKSKNGSIRESPQKTHRFFEMVSDNYQKNGKK